MADSKNTTDLKKAETVSIKDWFRCTPEEYQCFKPYQDNTFKDLQCVCGVSEKMGSVCKGIIKSRLGSRSTAGEVYILSYKNTYTALKLMPIISAESEKENNNEIEKALKASSLKTSETSDHFIAVYGYGLCPDVSLSSNFDNKMQEYSIYENIINSLPVKERKRAIALYKTTPFEEWVEIYWKDLDLQNIKKKAHILISELGEADLFVALSKTSDEEIWFNLIQDSLYAIHDLQTKMGAVHGDLHSKNLLVMRSGHVTIHDFGKSYYPIVWTIHSATVDIEMLINDLLSEGLQSVRPKNTEILLDGIQKTISSLTKDNPDQEIDYSNKKKSIPLLLLQEFF